MSKKEALEKYGIDERFIRNIGINIQKSSGYKKKNSIKIYIPKLKLELFQTFAVYLTLINTDRDLEKNNKKSSISEWVLKKMEDEIKRLLETKDPLFIEAQKVLSDIKRIEYEKMRNQ